MAQMDKKKLRMLNKLKETGFDTEKKISTIDMEEIYANDFVDIGREIVGLKKAIKAHSLLSYLLDGTDDQKEVKAHGETERSTGQEASPGRESWAD